ncbi:uncharacterized protein LOC134803681 [Cydia splendana]|uniref:uncharacterized protein LOC134803681 n=1 Tax=Cydia splendana TaxID=1100963 RepID=UPI0028F4619E
MSRCDCEGVFYRVFCVSLLVIAFTFTVILTNVFVDIDNLLSKRERESTENVGVIEHVTDNNEATTDIPDYYIGVDNDGGRYRNKRSLDSDNFFLRINSPKTKSYLTNKLASLLEALDDEDSDMTTPKPENGNIYIKTVKQKNNIEINNLQSEKQRGEDIVYLALHKMLQGIGHVNMYELIEKIKTLVRNFKRGDAQKENEHAETNGEFYSETTPKDIIVDEEQTLDNEMRYFNKALRGVNAFDYATNADNDTGTKTSRHNKHPAYILVDIKQDEKKENNSNGDFQGIIKFIYNGKPMKIRSEDSSESTTRTTPVTTTTTTTTTTEKNKKTVENTINNDVEDFAGVLKNTFKNRHLPDNYLKTITLEYLKKFEKSNESMSAIEKKKIRIKRNVESYEKQTETPHGHTKDDDELFVEIETHFDKSGLKGEKKRKLVMSLIDKIQNAIRSSRENTPITHANKEKDNNQREPLLKRIQTPLDRETVTGLPVQPIASHSSVYRTLDPISKSTPIVDPLPLVADQNGETWKKHDTKPKFLSSSKSINSAELNQVMVDYTKDIRYPAVGKRIQLPLSIDSSPENTNAEDLGKLQLLFKDIEGTGFSIGYNQYVDQVPDPESIKLFHGIENIVKKYHQKNDNPDQLGDHEGDYEIYGQELKKREVLNDEAPRRTKRFVMDRQNIRQSVKKVNHHRKNEYNYIYNNHYRSLNTYDEVHDIYKRSTEIQGNNLQGIIFKRKGKSSLINRNRKKGSVPLQTIMNSNKKMRFNKYLNTNAFPRHLGKIYYGKSKRSKRQVDKTGLVSENTNMFIVSDDVYNDNIAKPDLFFIKVMKSNKQNPLKNKPLFQPSNQPFRSRISEIKKQDAHNTNPIFFKSTSNDFIQIQVNKERNKRQLHTLRIIDRDMGQRNSDIYANQRIIAELDGPQIVDRENDEKADYHFSTLSNIPNMYKDPVNFDHNTFIFSNKNPTWERMIENPLMAKYPHIFTDTETIEDNSHFKKIQRSKESNTPFDNEDMYQSSNVRDLLKAVVPSHKNNYKISIRLIPRENNNYTNYNKPGFKEIHTSINKSYNKSGLRYSSQVNFTEISKVEIPDDNINRTHICNHHLNSTTPNINEATNPLQMESLRNNSLVDRLDNKNERNESVTTESNVEMNLLDIIIPSSPRKIFHLKAADLGKLLCNTLNSQNSETPSATQTENYTQKTTTMSTTTIEPTTTATTIKAEKHSTPATTTVDPLKIKLLKAMSQNQQLTSHILDRLDQNTDILQAYLSKISSEIAKLPDIYTTTTTTTEKIPVTQKNNIKPAATRNQYVINTSPVLKNHIKIDRTADIPISQAGNTNDPRRKGQTKYFIDTIFLNKTIVPHESNVRHRLDEEKTSKLNADLISNIPYADPSQAFDNNHIFNNIKRNAIVKNNSTHY